MTGRGFYRFGLLKKSIPKRNRNRMVRKRGEHRKTSLLILKAASHNLGLDNQIIVGKASNGPEQSRGSTGQQFPGSEHIGGLKQCHTEERRGLRGDCDT